MATWEIKTADVLDALRTMLDESVQCVVTSPPYWGLRSYEGVEPTTWPSGWTGHLGLEPTPEQHVENVVAVFDEVRRVLRSDGTLWLNYGDCYADKQRRLMPHRVALALQAAGWWVRSEIIWSKPNPMPASVRDRPTDAHELVFLLSRAPRYFYDADAVREEGKDWSRGGPGTGIKETQHYGAGNGGNGGLSAIAARYKSGTQAPGRNLRTVWSIPTHPFPEAHFATFPPALVTPPIKAGTSERGACSECGAPWRRVVERIADTAPTYKDGVGEELSKGRNRNMTRAGDGYTAINTTGWEPTCDHPNAPTRPCVVLDPFSGSGTTGLVALNLGRSYVGIEASPVYAEMSRKRIAREMCVNELARQIVREGRKWRWGDALLTKKDASARLKGLGFTNKQIARILPVQKRSA